jgi:aminoglycoside phosphotransferase (APT) family kinase protein
MEQFTAIHRVPIDAVRFLHRPKYGATGFADEFEYMRQSLTWSAAGGEVPPLCVSALEWLEKHTPKAPVDGLMWGDARIGNMMFNENFDVAAVFDWEDASLGGNMHDLGWWQLLDELASSALGIKRLDGLGTAKETVDLWQELTGQRATDLEWYQAFAGFRCAVVSIKTYRVRNHFVPGNNTGNNLATRWLARFLDQEPPADMR